MPRRKTAVALQGVAAPAPAPAEAAAAATVAAETGERAAAPIVAEEVDDRARLQPGDRVLLIVENDMAFARFLLDTAHASGFKGIVTSFGASAVALARDHKPGAITLDIRLPDIDGWRVLARLKNDLATRHIPVYIITTEEQRALGLEMGALDVLNKPLQSGGALEGVLQSIAAFLDRPEKRLLIVGEAEDELHAVTDLVGAGDIDVRLARAWSEAFAIFDQIDCAVLTPSMPDLPLAAVADHLAGRATPFVVNAAGAWTKRQATR